MDARSMAAQIGPRVSHGAPGGPGYPMGLHERGPRSHGVPRRPRVSNDKCIVRCFLGIAKLCRSIIDSHLTSFTDSPSIIDSHFPSSTDSSSDSWPCSASSTCATAGEATSTGSSSWSSGMPALDAATDLRARLLLVRAGVRAVFGCLVRLSMDSMSRRQSYTRFYHAITAHSGL